MADRVESNSASRIAELRQEMHALRALTKRANDTASYKRMIARSAADKANRLAREIESMGGKVRR